MHTQGGCENYSENEKRNRRKTTLPREPIFKKFETVT